MGTENWVMPRRQALLILGLAFTLGLVSGMIVSLIGFGVLSV